MNKISHLRLFLGKIMSTIFWKDGVLSEISSKLLNRETLQFFSSCSGG